MVVVRSEARLVDATSPGPDDACAAELFAVAREVVYAPIAGQSLVDQTVKRLTELVALGLVDVGELLPSEPDLAERLGISVATLREALAVLRGAGLVATRRGRGGGSVVMREVPPPPPEDARRLLAARSFHELRDLGDFRVAISGRAAALAAQRATPAEVELLERLAAEMSRASSFATYRRLDARLHVGIASAARSSWLTAAETTSHLELGDFLSLLAISPARLRVAHAQHAEMLGALRARDSTGASEAAEQHARTVTALLLEARSELAHVESERTVDYFAGLRPFGSELGTMAPDLMGEDALLRRQRSASSAEPGRADSTVTAT